ncbi:hypothetical protein ES706_02754 [subsurface metagenome]|nr:hypothetical protein [Bacillota bacterium]
METPVWLVPDRRKSSDVRSGKRKSPERRSSLRFIVHFPVEVKVEDLEKNISTRIKGEIVNLSKSGVDVVLKSPLDGSLRFSLIIQATFNALNRNIPVELVWTAPKIKGRGFLYGFKFLKLDVEQLISLREFLYLNDNFIIGQANSIIRLISEQSIIEKVRGFFTEDLKNYLEELVGLEKEIYQKGLTNLGQSKLNRLNDKILKKADKLEGIVGSSIISREIKRRFRLIVGGFVYQSLIVKRANDKPLGYPGDYELLEAIYNNQPVSEKIGHYFDKSFLSNKYAVAVRKRKEKMKVILSEFISRSFSPSVRILNLACGSCREIKELLSFPVIHKKRIIFEFVDQDGDALEFAKDSLGKLPRNIEIKFSKENILDIVNKPSYYSGLMGKQDLVYSIGLADYLPDRILKKLIRFCFGLLSPGGRLIITHKDVDKYKPLDPDWFCDWAFIPRNRKKISDLVKNSGIDNFSIDTERDDSQIILFLTITKR